MMLPILNANNWFPTVFDDFFNNDWMPRMKATAPAVNVKEDAKAYTMELAVPGIKKEFCRVNINADGNLEVAIENKLEHKEENKKEHFLRREFSYSNYQQTYVLPDDIEKDHIAAKVDNGVLTITLPKFTKEEVKQIQRQINID
ncbi:MAG: Hsp20/alpha crystallin family protein [Bacteroidales bacterium]|nr:Hsp20/alpha crystallin family protein [Bacteroidales bacterium]MDY2705553.1 Hsp20/alpha crystallin family protein [Alloprevotella sp.]MCI7614621.1 Hsp20/alpha crystallin family protein [Bacteroidales bacterium]MDD6593328.1 Hsp20/alpha crystallin family protein [Bacteroidales bacterium]MDD7233138.1 Hsp20/alpha crystallin family protein [Bacteroidales bacterium]